MYLQIKRKGDAVVVELPTVLDRYYTLTLDLGSDVVAALVASDLDGRIDKAVRLAREDSYTQGWADAKAKRSKRDVHSTWLEVK